jgi:cytochrome b561
MNSHTTTSKFIHWTFSLLYAYGIFKQVDELEQLEDASLLNSEIVFAVAFLVVVFIRYFYMKGTPTLLGAHDEMRKGHLFIAKTVHRLVYFSLIMLPATGLLIATLISFEIPGVVIAIALHELSASLSYLVIAIHIGASLYSRLKGEGIWNAMVPIWQEKGRVNSDLLSRLEILEDKTYDKIEEIFSLK